MSTALPPAIFAGGERERYTVVAIVLHWLIAATVVALLVIGLVMTNVPITLATTFTLYQIHKSLGISVLLLTALRVAWRAAHRPPPLPAGLAPAERAAARGAHYGLYLFTLVLPVSGWVLVSVAPLHVPTVLFHWIPWPDIPGLAGLPGKHDIFVLDRLLHHWAAWLLIPVILIHGAAALRHHLVLRDAVLVRMLPILGDRR